MVMTSDRKSVSLFALALLSAIGVTALLFIGCMAGPSVSTAPIDEPETVISGETGNTPAQGAQGRRPDQARSGHDRPRGVITVFVGNELTRRPVAEADVRFATQSSRTGPDGKVTFSVPADGLGDAVAASAEGFEPGEAILTAEAIEEVDIWLVPSVRGTGRVVDLAGNGVGDARVSTHARVATLTRSLSLGARFETPVESDGAFDFPISSAHRQFFARTASGLCGWQDVQPGQSDVVIRVQPGAALEILVEGTHAHTVQEARVELMGNGTAPGGSPPPPPMLLTLSNHRGKLEGLPPLAHVGITFPGYPGVWETRLGPSGQCTRVLAVLDDTAFKVALKWGTDPARPIASIYTAAEGSSSWHRVGKVLSRNLIELPARLFPPLVVRPFRFLDVDGRVVGFTSTSSFKVVGPGELECEAWPTQAVSGRAIDEHGRPQAGAVLVAYSLGRTSMREGRATSDSEGHFHLDIDNRHDVHLIGTCGALAADVTISAGAASLGDVVFSRPNRIAVTLRRGDSNSIYFISTPDTGATPGWPPPQGCKSDETVSVPVDSRCSAFIVSGGGKVIHCALRPGMLSYEIDLRGGDLQITIRLLDRVSRQPIPDADLWVGTAGLSPAWPQGQNGYFIRATTNVYGEAVVGGVVAGPIRVTLVPSALRVSNSYKEFRITENGQVVLFEVGGAIQLEVGYVRVVGTIVPIPTTKGLKIVALDRPLPRPMTGREMSAAGIKSSLVQDIQCVAGSYSALVNSGFPFLAAAIRDASDPVYANAGFLISNGDVWRGDLLLPLDGRHEEATVVLTADQEGPLPLPRVRVLWLEGGSTSSRDFKLDFNVPAQVSWPESASRVWIIATVQHEGRFMAGFVEPEAGKSYSIPLFRMPEVRLLNADGMSGRVSLAPKGLTPREWSRLGGGTPKLAGAGIYEFSGMDDAGRIRSIDVIVRPGGATLDLDAKSVLSGP